MMRSGVLCAFAAGLCLTAGSSLWADEVVFTTPTAVIDPIQLPVGPVPVIEERPWPVFAEVDYLLWWVRPASVPLSLVATTTGPPDFAGPGGRSIPEKRVLFGNTSLSDGAFSGLRLRFGLAPTDSGEPGVEFGGLVLPRTSACAAFSTPGNAPNGLLVPFLDSSRTPPTEGSLAVAGVLGGQVATGRIDVANATEAWGADIAASTRAWTGDDFRLDLRAGFRHFFFSDTFTLLTSSTNGGESFSTFDRFLTRNYFYGALGGARLSWEGERIEARVRFDLALGVTAESLRVGGLTRRPQSAIRARPGPAVVNGGLFSVSALGINREARFTALPELGLDLGYRLTDAVSLRLGYNFLYLSAVRRASEQISRSVDAQALAVNGGSFNNSPTPAPIDRSTNVTLHGLHFGVEVNF